jgi:FkbM family methyltransferase
MIISYAQNFEDIMLWRVLNSVENGTYIDIGAQDPIHDSVSYLFYQKGWRGINVEATSTYAEKLREARPDEIVIQAAVSDSSGLITFFEIPDTGISTGDAEIAALHRERGFEIKETIVPTLSLGEIFQYIEDREVHWLKIDVEGMERQVLAGWGESKIRPWIVVVESTLPLTQTEAFEVWEGLLFEKGYEYVYFDGLNRFYLSPAKLELRDRFSAGPNVFDGFSLSGTSSTSFSKFLLDKHAEELLQLSQLNENLLNSLQQSKADFLLQLEIINSDAQVNKTLLTKYEHRLETENLQIERLKQERVDLENTALAKNEAIAVMTRLEGDLRRQLDDLKVRYDEARSEKSSLQAIVSESEKRIGELLLSERAANLELKTVEGEFRSRIESLLENLNVSGRDNDSLKETIRIREGEISNLTQNASVENANLSEAYRAELAQYQKASDDLRTEIDALRSSTSWAVTEPLRTIATKWRMIRRPHLAANKPSALVPRHSDDAQFAESQSKEMSIASEVERGNWGDQDMSFNTHSLEQSIMTSTLNGENREHSALIPSPNISTLMQYEDRLFVEHAYVTLLRRMPDEDGFYYYLKQLRSGVPKVRLLGQIMYSREAKSAGVRLPGLKRAVLFQKVFSLPGVGPAIAAFIRPLQFTNDRTHEHLVWHRLEVEAQELQKMQLKLDRIQSMLLDPARVVNSSPVSPQVQPESPEQSPSTYKENDDGLLLSEDYSIDYSSWLIYLNQLIKLRLGGIDGKTARLVPEYSLTIIIDCTQDDEQEAELQKTINSLAALNDISNNQVKTYWYAGESSQFTGSNNANFPGSKRLHPSEVASLIGDKERVLIVKSGDELRPEFLTALRKFGAFDADLAIFDMFFEKQERVVPFLLHAVDPIHADACDYFLGRCIVKGKAFKAEFKTENKPDPLQIGAMICSSLDISSDKHVHISIPLVNARIDTAEIVSMRNAAVLGMKRDQRVPTSIEVARKTSEAQVSIIICTKDSGLLLRQLVHRLVGEPLVKEIIIVSNNTSNIHAIKTLEEFSGRDRVKILQYNESFNFSRQCNLGASEASGEFLLFLNDDMAPVSEDWVQRFVGWMDKPRIVGALLIYPNERVQHGGMHLGFNGVAGHVLRHAKLPDGDYGFFLSAPRRVSCLTGAALMMPKSLFSNLNGFDPLLAMAYQDVDLSLRALHSGFELVFDPNIILMHMESISIVPTLKSQKTRRSIELEYTHFNKRWKDARKHDAWMNPLFDPQDESLRKLRL